MNIYEASSFYGDFSMLLAEYAKELSSDEVEDTTPHESFNEV